VQPDAGSDRSGMPPTHNDVRPVLLAAAGLLVSGTAWIDPSRLPLLLIPLTFLLAAYGAGASFLRYCLGESESSEAYPTIQLAVRIGTGLAGLTLLAVATALCGLLWIAAVAAIPLAALGSRDLIRACITLRAVRLSAVQALGGVVLGAAWLIVWLWGTIPPVFFDELAYHLVIPQRAIATGTLQVAPWVYFTLMPHASDLLLSWGMAAAGDLGARATHASAWVLCFLAACALADAVSEPRGNSWTPAMIAGVLMTSPMIWFLGTLPFAELWLASAVLIACVLLIRPDLYNRPWLALGLALWLVGATKLAGVFWIGALLVAAFGTGWPWKDILKAGGVTAAAMTLWWARAAFYTGNPLYPMFHRRLGGTGWNDENHARLLGDLPYGWGGLGVPDLLRLPLDLVQYPDRFGSASDAGIVAVVSTGALVILPVVARWQRAGAPERHWMDAAAVFMLMASTYWVWTTPMTRFFAPAFLIGLAACVGSCLRLPRRGLAAGLLIIAAAALWGTQRFLAQHELVFSSSQVALGRESRDAFLERHLDHFKTARFVRETLPGNARLLFIGETRPYYFARDAVAPSAYDSHPLARWVEEAASTQALAAKLAVEGITHVVLNTREFHRLQKKYGLLAFTGEGAEEKDRRLKSLPQALQLLYKDNGLYVYAVPPRRE
jgi:hypothetical protein